MLSNGQRMYPLLGLSKILVRGRVFKAADHSSVVSTVLSSSQRWESGQVTIVVDLTATRLIVYFGRAQNYTRIYTNLIESILECLLDGRQSDLSDLSTLHLLLYPLEHTDFEVECISCHSFREHNDVWTRSFNPRSTLGIDCLNWCKRITTIWSIKWDPTWTSWWTFFVRNVNLIRIM